MSKESIFFQLKKNFLENKAEDFAEVLSSLPTLTEREIEEYKEILQSIFQLILVSNQNRYKNHDIIFAEILITNSQATEILNKIAQEVFWQTIERNYTSSVNFLLNHCLEKIDLEAFHESKQKKPIAFALSHNNIPLVELLITKGATINTNLYETNNISLLDWILIYKNIPLIRLILQTSHYNKICSEFFFKIVESQKLTNIEFLIQNSNRLEYLDEKHNSLLHLAAKIGNSSICKLILQKNAINFWLKNQEGKYPIFIAVEKGNLEIFEILTEREEAKNILRTSDYQGDNLLHMAVMSNNVALCEAVMNSEIIKLKYCELTSKKNFTGELPIFSAVKLLSKASECDYVSTENRINIIKFLFPYFLYSPGETNFEGETLLHYAAKSLNLEVFNLIYSNVPELINISDIRHKNIIHSFMETVQNNYKTTDFFKKIFRFIPDILFQSSDTNGHTPLDIAISNKPELIEYILDRKPFLKYTKNFFGENILHLACLNANVALCSKLISKFGLDPKSETNTGHNILHKAIFSKSYVMVKWVVENLKSFGLNINQTDGLLKTPLMIATENQQEDIILFLKENNAKLFDEDLLEILGNDYELLLVNNSGEILSSTETINTSEISETHAAELPGMIGDGVTNLSSSITEENYF